MPSWEELKKQFEVQYQTTVEQMDAINFAQSFGVCSGMLAILKQFNSPPAEVTTAMLNEWEARLNNLAANLPPPIQTQINLLGRIIVEGLSPAHQAESEPAAPARKKSTYREEYVTCGNKGCICKSGRQEDKHGPYVYEIYVDGHGKRRRRSHGKMTLAEFQQQAVSSNTPIPL